MWKWLLNRSAVGVSLEKLGKIFENPHSIVVIVTADIWDDHHQDLSVKRYRYSYPILTSTAIKQDSLIASYYCLRHWRCVKDSLLLLETLEMREGFVVIAWYIGDSRRIRCYCLRHWRCVKALLLLETLEMREWFVVIAWNIGDAWRIRHFAWGIGDAWRIRRYCLRHWKCVKD